MYGNQFGEFVFRYWGIKIKAIKLLQRSHSVHCIHEEQEYCYLAQWVG